MTFPSNATLADARVRSGPTCSPRAPTSCSARRQRVLVAFPDGRVVVSTDLLVDFRRDWASALDIGHRVAAADLSDLNAMGGHAARSPFSRRPTSR